MKESEHNLLERYCKLNRLEELILLKSSYIQSNIQIQQNPYQNSNSISTEIEQLHILHRSIEDPK